jgi:hypothetical protein
VGTCERLLYKDRGTCGSDPTCGYKDGGVSTAHTAIVAVLVVSAGCMLAARLRLVDASGFLVAVAVLASAEVVGLSEVLSLCHALSRWGITAGVAVVAVVALLLWRRAGSPRPEFALGAWPQRWREHLGVTVVLGVVAVALGFQLWMGLRIPPNETDSLIYHLPRAVGWMQRHSALQFRPGPAGERLVNNPINGELFVAWTMALSHGDRLANAVQWCFALGLGGAVAAGARLLGFKRSAALLAAGGFLLFPEVLLQSATTQVDLVVTFFVAAAAVFVARALRHACASELVLAAVAFGLALGTKESVLLAAPGLAMIVGASWWRYRPPARMLRVGAAAGIAAVIVFGSFNYVQNLVHTGEPSGGENATVAADSVRAGLVRNLARVSSTLVDAPGLPGASTAERLLNPVAARVVGTVHGSYFDTPPAIHTAVDDGESGYGLLGLLVLVPVVSVVLLRGPAPQRVLALGAVAYLVLFAAGLGYSPEAPRLLLPAATLVSPLLARLEGHPGRRRAMVAVALAGVVPVLTLNTDKPLLQKGAPNVLSADRIEAQMINPNNRPSIAAVKALNRLIPDDAKLGVVGLDDPDYVLYDRGLHRQVIDLARWQLDPVELARRGFVGAFIWPTDLEDCADRDCVLPPAAIPLPGGAGLLLAARPGRHP